MANKLYEESNIQAIANAIRAKGQSGTMTVAQMPEKISNISGGGGLTPKTLTGNTNNTYVSQYIADARTTYANDTDRTTSVVMSYNAVIEGVRKDNPTPITTSMSSGTLKKRDNDSLGTQKATLSSSGNVDLYNFSKDGGDFILESNNAVTDCGTVKASNDLRMIYAPSIRNVRDMGGWACDGGTVKYGLVYRGGDINDNTYGMLSAEDKAMFLDFLKIKNEIDYSEIGTASGFGADVHYTNVHTNSSYVALVDLSRTAYLKLKEAILSVFEYVAKNQASYFHCTFGADRTGATAFMLGALLGMNEVDLDIDYELTSFTINASVGTALTKRRDYSIYKGMIDYIKQCSTSSNIRDCAVAWCVLAGININEINAFRQNMIDGNPETVTAQINYEARSITLSTSSITINVGGSQTVSATLTPFWATSTITWASSDTTKVTVVGSVKNATITAVASGSATITATANGHSATVLVTAQSGYGITNNLTNVTTNNSATFIMPNESYTATLSVQELYHFDTVIVTMGGVDVTSSVYDTNTHIISIDSVTGDLIITATASQGEYTNVFVPSSANLNYRISGSGEGGITAYNGCFVSNKINISDLSKTDDHYLYVYGASMYGGTKPSHFEYIDSNDERIGYVYYNQYPSIWESLGNNYGRVKINFNAEWFEQVSTIRISAYPYNALNPISLSDVQGIIMTIDEPIE